MTTSQFAKEMTIHGLDLKTLLYQAAFSADTEMINVLLVDLKKQLYKKCIYYN